MQTIIPAWLRRLWASGDGEDYYDTDADSGPERDALLRRTEDSLLRLVKRDDEEPR